jgi:hypothetical protein
VQILRGRRTVTHEVNFLPDPLDKPRRTRGTATDARAGSAQQDAHYPSAATDRAEGVGHAPEDRIMSAHAKRQDYAASLLDDIRASRDTLPRKEQLTHWLQDYVREARTAEREMDVALATENLLAIHAHLAAFDVPATVRPSLN